MELDLRKEKESFIMYERLGHCSTVSIGYEQQLDFCKACDKVGHSTQDCAQNQTQHMTKATAPDKPVKLPTESVRATKDTTKEWVRIGKKKADPSIHHASPSSTSTNTMIPTTNAMIPYVAPSLSPHNAFSVLTHEETQEDLLAHTVLKKRDHDPPVMDEQGPAPPPTHNQPLNIIPEDSCDPLDGITAS